MSLQEAPTSSFVRRCCLCTCDLSTSKGKTHRKRLSSCSQEVSKLQQCFMETCNGNIHDYSEFSDDSVLCYQCLQRLGKLVKYEKETAELKQQISSFLQRFASDTEGSRKRTLPPESQTPQPKRSNSQPKRIIDPSKVSVLIGSKRYDITPRRIQAVRRIARRNYVSFSNTVVKLHSQTIIRSLSYIIRKEFKNICSDQHSSVLRGDPESIKTFSWLKIWNEIKEHVPTLVSLLTAITPANSQPLVCTVVSMLLKRRHQRMGFLPKVISALFYANGVHKQIYKCLHPLMLCQSHKGTLDLIDSIVKDYDSLPISWRNDLIKRIQLEQAQSSDDHNLIVPGLYDSSGSDSDACTFNSPPVSPRSVSSLSSHSPSVIESLFDDVNDEQISSDNELVNTVPSAIGQAEMPSLGDLSATIGELSATMTEISSSVPHSSTIDSPSIGELSATIQELSATILEMSATNGALELTARATCPESEAVSSQSQAVAGSQTVVHRTCEPDVSAQDSEKWTGFKLVGDNIDKNFRRSFYRHDRQTISMHAFHMYAVKDRIDFSLLSDVAPTGAKVDVTKLLIDQAQVDELNKHVVTLLSRILIQNFKKFSAQKDDVEWHIKSIYSEEMSKKSQVVPLGVFQRNENKIDEMCDILDKLHEYVPAVDVNESYDMFDDGIIEVEEEMFHQILFGGDQLTVARARGSAAIRCDHVTSICSRRDRLEGLFPVAEDWHTKQCLLKAIWKHFYKKSSSSDMGTLSQLKILLNRGASLDPEDNMKGCEDFLMVILHAHVNAAAEKLLSEQSYDKVEDLAKAIVHNYVFFDPAKKISRDDKVHLYATQVMTLLLFWHAFNDAVKEGDGDRIIDYWRFLLVIFRVKGHRNYCKQAIVMLSQYHCLLSDRMAAQLKWSRFVNTTGRAGKNISCDLHLEHLNRRLKGLITGLRSNASSKSEDSIYPSNAINRAARSIGVLHHICNNFEEQNDIKGDVFVHYTPSLIKDVEIVQEVLKEMKVFDQYSKRKHSAFPNLNAILQQCPPKHLKKWITERLKVYRL